jgi:hypothetical protein
MSQYEVWKALKDSGEPLCYCEIKRRVPIQPSNALGILVRQGFIRKVPSGKEEKRRLVAYQVVEGLEFEPPAYIEV